MSSDSNINEPEQSSSTANKSVATVGVGTAEEYILSEIKKTKVAIRRTQGIGGAILLIAGIQLGYITAKFCQSLQPKVAAEIADGLIMQQIGDKGPELAMQIKQKIPEYLAQTPDYVLQQLPEYRESVEEKVEETLSEYCQKTSEQLAHRVDNYLDTNKDEIKGMLTAPEDPEIIQETGQKLREELMAYLKEKPTHGESIQSQIDKALASLQEFEKKMKHLAAGKNLTPEEKKTRRVIAVLGRSINDQNLGQKAQELARDVKTIVQ